MSDCYVGQIQIFAFDFVPTGWALCDGTVLPISENEALFSLLGTTYGGDGLKTFGLPNFQGRAAYHFGSGPGLNPMNLGEMAGSETRQLAVAHLAAHSHSLKINCNSAAGNSDNPQNNFPATANENAFGTTKNATMSSMQTNNDGGGQAFSIRSPFLALNFCICLEGVFPSQK